MRIRAHAARAFRDEFQDLRPRRAVGIEQLRRPIAAQPFLEHAQVRRIRGHSSQRYLVRAPSPLHLYAVDNLRPGPTLRTLQNDHGPPWPEDLVGAARMLLYRGDFVEHALESARHLLVHRFGLIADNEVRLPAVTRQQA